MKEEAYPNSEAQQSFALFAQCDLRRCWSATESCWTGLSTIEVSHLQYSAGYWFEDGSLFAAHEVS